MPKLMLLLIRLGKKLRRLVIVTTNLRHGSALYALGGRLKGQVGRETYQPAPSLH